MPTFAFAGRTRAGELVNGERLADSVDAAVKEAIEQLGGGVDVLINNAGLGFAQSAGLPPDDMALAVIDVKSKAVRTIGTPATIRSVDASPDGQYFRVTRMVEPYSYIVPTPSFGSVRNIVASARLRRAQAASPSAAAPNAVNLR